MKFINIVIVAISSIRRNKLRSFLTALGIIIGVASVIAMLAIGEGSNISIRDQISSMGTNLISVSPSSQNRGGVQKGFETSQTLKEEDVDYIKKNCELVQVVSPEVRSSGQTIFGSNNWPTSIYGGNLDYPFIKKYEVKSGRMFNEQEIRRADKVCLIGKTVADNLFGEGVDPIGNTIRFNKIPFKIIGVLQEKGQSSFGMDQDDMLLAPYTTIMKRITRQTYLRGIIMSAYSEDQIANASNEVETALRTFHKLKEYEENDFSIRSQDQLISTFSSISDMLIVLLGSIAAISLIVGGIGIMNIMYVSVTERTREIGLRLAIGGKGKDILKQFLFEAMLLSVLGGIIGVLFGISLSKGVEFLMGWPILVKTESIIMSFMFCTFIGVFFGWYPAKKAAHLEPIDALRHE